MQAVHLHTYKHSYTYGLKLSIATHKRQEAKQPIRPGDCQEEQKGQEAVSNTGLRSEHTPFSTSASATKESVFWTPNLKQLCGRPALKALVWP